MHHNFVISTNSHVNFFFTALLFADIYFRVIAFAGPFSPLPFSRSRSRPSPRPLSVTNFPPASVLQSSVPLSLPPLPPSPPSPPSLLPSLSVSPSSLNSSCSSIPLFLPLFLLPSIIRPLHLLIPPFYTLLSLSLPLFLPSLPLHLLFPSSPTIWFSISAFPFSP